jgi:hypothetical protein
MYVCVILNNTYAPSIHAMSLQMVTGTTNEWHQSVALFLSLWTHVLSWWRQPISLSQQAMLRSMGGYPWECGQLNDFQGLDQWYS